MIVGNTTSTGVFVSGDVDRLANVSVYGSYFVGICHAATDTVLYENIEIHDCDDWDSTRSPRTGHHGREHGDR